MTLLAIDPGATESGWVVLTDEGVPSSFGKSPNDEVREIVYTMAGGDCRMAVEMIASYGMPVGAEVFETCVWVGRFIEAWTGPGVSPDVVRVYRRDVKLHLCGQARAKDGNIRQALIDRYGGKDAAIGKKATPGPCYKMSGDMWAALAVAVCVHDGVVH